MNASIPTTKGTETGSVDLSGAANVLATGTDLSGAPHDLSGAVVSEKATEATEATEAAPRTAQIVGTATAAALPLLATLLGVVSPPMGFLMAIAAPAIVSRLFPSDEPEVKGTTESTEQTEPKTE